MGYNDVYAIVNKFNCDFKQQSPTYQSKHEHQIKIMSQASPEPSTSSSGGSERLTERDKTFILYYLATARALLGRDEDDTSMAVYRKLCELLEANRERRHLSATPPHVVTIRRLWSKVCEVGSIQPTKGQGRKEKQCREEIEFLAKTTKLSNRGISDQLGMVSRETVRKVCKKLKMHAYKQPTGQKLRPIDIQRRAEFARDMHHRITAAKSIRVEDILFTDECCVGIGDGINRQNDRH